MLSRVTNPTNQQTVLSQTNLESPEKLIILENMNNSPTANILALEELEIKKLRTIIENRKTSENVSLKKEKDFVGSDYIKKHEGDIMTLSNIMDDNIIRSNSFQKWEYYFTSMEFPQKENLKIIISKTNSDVIIVKGLLELQIEISNTGYHPISYFEITLNPSGSILLFLILL